MNGAGAHLLVMFVSLAVVTAIIALAALVDGPIAGYCQEFFGDAPDGWHRYDDGVSARCVAGVPVEVRR